MSLAEGEEKWRMDDFSVVFLLGGSIVPTHTSKQHTHIHTQAQQTSTHTHTQTNRHNGYKERPCCCRGNADEPVFAGNESKDVGEFVVEHK